MSNRLVDRSPARRLVTGEHPRLWSLLELMKRFDGRWAAWYTASRGTHESSLKDFTLKVMPNNPLESFRGQALSEENRRCCLEDLDKGEEFFSEFGFAVSIATMNVMRRTLNGEGCTLGRIAELGEELKGRLMDELDSTCLMAIEPSQVHLYQGEQLFGPLVEKKFPSTIEDISEAGKCLACGRDTAAVFHLMRVMEVGLKVLARALGIKYAPSWDSYLRQISKKMSVDHKLKPPAWKKNEAFYRDVSGDLLNVKFAWRNPTMHVKKSHGSEEAALIFASTKIFMQRMATKLREPKARDA